MTHQRIDIRNHIVGILSDQDGLSDLFVSRGRPVSERRVPFCAVVIAGETVTKKVDHISESRRLDVRIVLVVKALAGADEALDALAENVEYALAADWDFDGLIERQEYKSAQFDFEGGAAGDLASAELRYDVEYIYEPSRDFDDLSSVAVGIDMSSPRNDPQVPATPDGQIDARVTVENLEA